MSCNNFDKPLTSSPSPKLRGVEDVKVIDSSPVNPWLRARDQNCVDQLSNCSFRDLMSEDMAKDLQHREEQLTQTKLPPRVDSTLLDLDETSLDTSSDYMVALLLQEDFNREHDIQINREERHFNKNSKLSVSFSKYKVCGKIYNESDDEENFQNLEDENRAIDKFEESRRSDPVIPACGYTRHNNVMVTKHDKTLSGRRNAERVMNFPPGFNTGDAGGFDMQISNKVYNKLARTAMTESKRKQRVQDKMDKATTEKALDIRTKLIVYKLVNSSVLESVNEIISTGKESVVFHASGGLYGDAKLPSECAVKVFKTTLTDFKTRERYIRDDYRFKDRMSKNNNKMMIQLWAEKEFHNLRRLEKAKIPSPKPFLIKKHVLVMSFIGTERVAAPKLKHVTLSEENWCNAYKQITDIMTTMFRGCRLVHGDMSEYNILWHNKMCWVIDLGQSVEPSHPHALKFLYRDCSNVISFFRSKGLRDLPSPLSFFKLISGIDIPTDNDEETESQAEKLVEPSVSDNSKEIKTKKKKNKKKTKKNKKPIVITSENGDYTNLSGDFSYISTVISYRDKTPVLNNSLSLICENKDKNIDDELVK